MPAMKDQDIANSILNDYKLMCSSINTYITEAQNQNLRNDYINVLQDMYNCQKQMFDTMSQKGWYQVQNADMSEIARAQQQYAKVQL
ncbi:spore coat protein [Candidatus Contubernalis alkaliaceticus]|uniref:spore coat protein n=1 Tax=Candidatus Contubernalis alkaliaceticus TaxID=338645 RepID=UPI001F4BE446|nr:spore coat protein [Candidatus Contubernalis alkalaceticus]UNC92382.1 spore coat protein [Candidatus Contubernalis alkalaceticus]